MSDPEGNFTIAIGISGLAEAFGFGAGEALMFVIDDNLNMGLYHTPGYKGWLVPTASIGINISFSGADTIDDLEGTSAGMGGSYDWGFNVGIEGNTAVTKEDENIFILDINLGIGAGLLPGELHANLEYTDFIWKKYNNPPSAIPSVKKGKNQNIESK
jgi:hypothetical protein